MRLAPAATATQGLGARVHGHDPPAASAAGTVQDRYFCVDSRDSRAGRLLVNRTVGLRDTWAKIESSPASTR